MKKLAVLIVKFGALGDVVRTSYFVNELSKSKLVYWITSEVAAPLLQNPVIERVFTKFEELIGMEFDLIYSLDDEYENLRSLARFSRYKKLIGAYISQSGNIEYSEDSREWFDMGLCSRSGRVIADRLKKQNQKSHVQIFSRIFQVNERAIAPSFFYPKHFRRQRLRKKSIGVNPFAGDRWPSKGLLFAELERLTRLLIEDPDLSEYSLTLLGINKDYLTATNLCKIFPGGRVVAVDTSESLHMFADVISQQTLLITADTLALHLAIAQQIPSVSFFSPTSAAEIDVFNLGEKIISSGEDYCSYRPNCDNSSITGVRLYEAAKKVLSLNR